MDNLVRIERVNTPSHRIRDLQLAFVNSCSVRNYVVSNDINIVLLTETRLTYSDAVKRADVTPDGYKLKANPRSPDRTGGGVGILFKSGTKCKVVSSGELD